MKRTKLLIPTLSLTPVICLTACNNGNSVSEDIADAIIKPAELSSSTKITSFKDSLKGLSSDDLKKEVVYDLFGIFNTKGNYKLNAADSFASLYKSNKVGIKTNITKCGIDYKNDKPMVYFLGYVSFVFLSDYSDTYKTNDYVMLTYDIQDQEVKLDEDTCSLTYEITSEQAFKPYCVGFAKIRYSNGKEVMQYIDKVDTNQYTIKNSHNWTK